MAITDTTRPRGASGEPRLSVVDIKARLDLVEEAGRLTDLKARGRELWGLCPFHHERSPSFKVDPKRQTFHCFGCGAHGDAIDLIAASRGISVAEALALLRDRTADRAPIRRPEPQPAEDDKEAAAKQAEALQIWRETIEIGPDDFPARYLRERRKIKAWDSDRVRWHPTCRWGENRPPVTAIVAPVTGAAGLVTAIWRIRPSLTGRVRRAGLGRVKGGAARLFDVPGDELAIGEGIESSLAVHQRTGLRCWSALNAENMRALVVPERYRRINIFADKDPHGLGQAAAHELAARLRGEGRRAAVYICVDGGDANDLLMREAG